MDLLDRMRCEVLAFRAPCTIGHRFGFQQQLIVSLNKLSGDVGQFVPNLGYYIVSDERGVGLIGRKRPLRLAVKVHIFIEKLGQGDALGDNEGSRQFLVLYLSLAGFRLGHTLKGFPFLFTLAGFVTVAVNHTILFILANDGCHLYHPLLFFQIRQGLLGIPCRPAWF